MIKLGGLTTRLSSGYLSQKLRAAFTDQETREAMLDRFRIDGAGQIAQTLGRMRGGAMKFGQVLSVAVEHLDLPDEVRVQLSKLQSDGEPVAFETIRATIESELGQPVERLFAWLDPQPLGTASLAQAHAARLPDGREVVVKVLHDGVESAVEADLVALRAVFFSARAIGRDRDELAAFFDEISEKLHEELDYLQEAANIEAFRLAFSADDPRVRIPSQYNRYCTERVLVLDRLPGVPLRQFLESATPEQRQKAGENLADLFLVMAFEHRLLHADPHPGNYLFEEDGRIGLLDFGCVKRFRATWIGLYAQVALAALDDDRDSALHSLEQLGVWDGVDARAAAILWDFCESVAGPLREGPSTFDAEDRLLERVAPLAKAVLHTPNIHGPRDIIFLHRTLAGMYTLVRQLGVTADWASKLRSTLPKAIRAAQFGGERIG